MHIDAIRYRYLRDTLDDFGQGQVLLSAPNTPDEWLSGDDLDREIDKCLSYQK